MKVFVVLLDEWDMECGWEGERIEKVFGSEEKAEEYILNQPISSVKDRTIEEWEVEND